MNKISILVVVIILLIGGLFVFNKTPDVNTPDTPALNTTSNTILITDSIESPGQNVESQPTVKEFTVTGVKFSFAPNTIEVKKGDRVKITFKNSDGFHDFKLDEFSVATSQIQTGAEESVEFIADKAGSFEYYCSVGSHRQLGMEGAFIVTE